MAIKNVILGIAIIIAVILTAVYGMNTLYPSPEYNKFCNTTYREIANASECLAYDGVWNPPVAPQMAPYPSKAESYCDLYYNCNQKFETANKAYWKKMFFISVPLGVILIAVGGIFFALEVVGAGLMGGGIGVILYGAGGYWAYTENWMRFLMSLMALAALIYLAYYLNKKFSHDK